MIGVMEVRAVRALMAAVAADFDADLLTGAEAAVVVNDAAAIERSAQLVKLLALARVHASGPAAAPAGATRLTARRR